MRGKAIAAFPAAQLALLTKVYCHSKAQPAAPAPLGSGAACEKMKSKGHEVRLPPAREVVNTHTPPLLALHAPGHSTCTLTRTPSRHVFNTHVFEHAQWLRMYRSTKEMHQLFAAHSTACQQHTARTTHSQRHMSGPQPHTVDQHLQNTPPHVRPHPPYPHKGRSPQRTSLHPMSLMTTQHKPLLRRAVHCAEEPDPQMHVSRGSQTERPHQHKTTCTRQAAEAVTSRSDHAPT